MVVAGSPLSSEKIEMNSTFWVPYTGEGKPVYQTKDSAGCDLQSNVDAVIPSGEWMAIGTGLRIAIPTGFVGQVCPRSGLAMRGITVLNAPGIIDPDYRGEVKVILINHSTQEYYVKKGDRIAQLIFTTALQATLLKADNLPETQRGEMGFGSTGM